MSQLEQRKLRRMAYHQGGADGVEPSVYKSEDYKGVRDGQDKQMHQDKSMGGDSGMFPGDAEAKGRVHRAKRISRDMTKEGAYSGPSLKTRFSVRKNRNGSIDRANSLFEVFAGNKRVIAAPAKDIFGPELNSNWNWLKSKEYGQEVCKQVRASGLGHVRGLLKGAQDAAAMPELPPLPDMGGDAGLDAAPADMGEMSGELPPMGGEMDLPELEEAPEEAEEAPSEAIDGRLADMEGLIDEVRDLVDQLKDQSMADVNVDVNVGDQPQDEESELVQLSSELSGELKVSIAELSESADELAMVAETYDNIGKLSANQRTEFSKLASDALRDSSDLVVQTKTLVRVSKQVLGGLTKRAGEHGAMDLGAPEAADQEMDEAMDYSEDDAMDYVKDDAMDLGAPEAADQEMELVSAAMQMRRDRRNSILKQARDRHLTDRRLKRESALKAVPPEGNTDPTSDVKKTASEDPAGVSATIQNDVSEAVGSAANSIKSKMQDSLAKKKAEEDREGYRTKLRRAYDVGLMMQTKGLLSNSKTALDKQVDEVMAFDDRAFEAFKRSIGNAKPVRTMKVASDLGGINIGVESDTNTQSSRRGANTIDALALMWD
jgi:hypothetical protein